MRNNYKKGRNNNYNNTNSSLYSSNSSSSSSSFHSHSHSHNNNNYNNNNNNHSSSFSSSSYEQFQQNDFIINEIYQSKVKTIINQKNYCGLYVKIFKNNKYYENDYFLKNILKNKKNENYKKYDQIQLKCISINPLKLILLPEDIRPLLILDINGPLGNRAPFDSSYGKRIFISRKYTKEFINLCSQYYEIAVWSCARRNNIELELFSDINLLFVWSQEEATSLYPRTSFISPAKPLFLKELSKVFERFPGYDYTNTILLENHVEKFERNLFGSGILCPDFDTEKVDEDEILNPNGELATYLVEIATQNPLNVIKYISERAGTSSYFPTEYPQPPPETPLSHKLQEDNNNEDNENNTLKLDSLADEESHCSEKSFKIDSKETNLINTNSTDHDLLWYYLFHACNQNSKVTQQSIDRKTLPGPKTIAFHYRDIVKIQQKPNNFVVCEKTDGERAILVISPQLSQIYFVYRNQTVEKIYNSSNTQSKLDEWIQSLSGLTILDGELVSEHNSTNTIDQKRVGYLIFDAVYLNGQFIGKESDQTLLTRMELTKQFLNQNHEQMNNLFIQSNSLPIFIQAKEMKPVLNIQEIVSNMTTNNEKNENLDIDLSWGWIYNDKDFNFPHLSDGLVFTPILGSYYEYMAIKWKSYHMCTNDYLISIQDILSLTKGNTLLNLLNKREYQIQGYLPINSKDKNSTKIEICQIILSSTKINEIIFQLEKSPIKDSFLVVECYYVKKLSNWKVYKVRYDKSTANTLLTAWNNLEVISEGLDLETLTQKILEPISDANLQSNYEPTLISSGVDKHYDDIQIQRQTGFREARLTMHRKVMNWSKACLLQQILSINSQNYRFIPSNNIDTNQHFLQQALQRLEKYENDRKTNQQIPNFLQNQNNSFRKKGKKYPIKIVDIACGRGGDTKKFTSESIVEMYLGIDISQEQIKEATERAKENRFLKNYEFILGDVGSENWYTQIETQSYDIAWCMFAFHYFCDTEFRCRNFFASASYLLKSKGKLTLTFPSPYAIYNELNEVKETDSFQAEPPLCSVKFVPKNGEESFNKTIDECLESFGIGYSFTLGDAVQDCEEYFVPLKRVISIANEFGFSFIEEDQRSKYSSIQSMHEWIQEICLNNENYLSLREIMQVTGQRSPGRNVSSEEWNAIGLYMCLTLVKQ